jgi:hypothetical protein
MLLLMAGIGGLMRGCDTSLAETSIFVVLPQIIQLLA